MFPKVKSVKLPDPAHPAKAISSICMTESYRNNGNLAFFLYRVEAADITGPKKMAFRKSRLVPNQNPLKLGLSIKEMILPEP